MIDRVRRTTEKVVDFIELVLMLPFCAFSSDVAREIFERDNGTCQCCGVNFSDGFMLHCSHFDHNRQSRRYDSPDNGQLECLRCHLFRVHLPDLANNPRNKSARQAVRMLVSLIYAEGYHTWGYYDRYGTSQRDRDIDDMWCEMQEWGFDPEDFIDNRELKKAEKRRRKAGYKF